MGIVESMPLVAEISDPAISSVIATRYREQRHGELVLERVQRKLPGQSRSVPHGWPTAAGCERCSGTGSGGEAGLSSP